MKLKIYIEYIKGLAQPYIISQEALQQVTKANEEEKYIARRPSLQERGAWLNGLSLERNSFCTSGLWKYKCHKTKCDICCNFCLYALH